MTGRRGSRGHGFARLVVVGLLVLHATLFVDLVRHSAFDVQGETHFTLGDDAMISMRYAANLAAGRGLVWNEGERVQGISNLGWTLAMAAVHALGVPPPTTSLVVSSINLVLDLVLLVFLFTHLERRAGPWVALTAVALVAVNVPLLFWGFFGFATSLQALAVAAAFLWLIPTTWRAPERPSAGAGAMLIWAAIAFWARSDGLAVVLLAWACGAWLVMTGGVRLRDLRWQAAISAGSVGAILAWQRFSYGDWLPNTAHHKLVGSEGVRAGLADLARFAIGDPFCLPLLVAAAVYLGVGLVRDVRGFMPPVIVVGGWLGYVVLIGGDAFPFGRFFVVVIPLLAVLTALLVRALVVGLRNLGGVAASARTASTLAVLAAVTGLCLPYLGAVRHVVRPPWIPQALSVSSVEIARGLEASEVPRSTVIAVFLAGTTPYFMPEHRFHDLLGKSDRQIARSPSHPGPPGHNKWDYAYSLDQVRPGLILTGGTFGGLSDQDARRHVADGPTPIFHPALWIDPFFRAAYRDNRVLIALDGVPIDNQWAYARDGANLGRLEIVDPSFPTPAAAFQAWATSRVEGVSIGRRLASAWPLEGPEGGQWLWLGEGPDEGMRFAVESTRRIAVEVVLDARAGPGRADALRRLRWTLEHDERAATTGTVELEGAAVPRWPVELEAGINRLTIEVLDRATIKPLANGDPRGLLVQLHRLTLEPVRPVGESTPPA